MNVASTGSSVVEVWRDIKDRDHMLRIEMPVADFEPDVLEPKFSFVMRKQFTQSGLRSTGLQRCSQVFGAGGSPVAVCKWSG